MKPSKVCKWCGEKKPLTDYGHTTTTISRLNPLCKRCATLRARIQNVRWAGDKEALTQLQQEYYALHAETIVKKYQLAQEKLNQRLQTRRAYQSEYRKTHPEKKATTEQMWVWRNNASGIYSGLKAHARYPVEMSREKFIEWFNQQEQKCFYCGTEFTLGGSSNPKKRTIDRKDSTKGYSLHNIALCCWRCNRVKSNVFTEEQMLEIAQRYFNPLTQIRQRVEPCDTL